MRIDLLELGPCHCMMTIGERSASKHEFRCICMRKPRSRENLPNGAIQESSGQWLAELLSQGPVESPRAIDTVVTLVG